MSGGTQNPWDQSRPKFRRQPASGNAGNRRSDGNKRNSEKRPIDQAANQSVPAPEATVREIRSGRLLAWHVLQLHDNSDQFLQDLFAAADGMHELSSQERAAAVDIAAGVLRRRRTIDALLRSQISRPGHQVEKDLWRVLQVGVVQLVFGRTPVHAAVDSTVELCRDLDRERWTKFTNGVLRGVSRLLTDEDCNQLAADALPISRGRFRRLTSEIFPDPSQNLAGYIAEAFSLPDVLAGRWVTHLSVADLLSACFHACDPPVTSLRINVLRSSRNAVVALLESQGCSVATGHLDASLLVSGTSRIEKLSGFSEGFWSVQDESAMSAALLLNPQPGESILDLCAAPGGKTCHLAELSADSAHIVACDVSDSRLQRIQENLLRLRINSVETLLVGRDGEALPDGPFDAVLVDVPCSNTGVLNRRPEARWRFDEAAMTELIPLQTRLLLYACERVRPGGRVVYSTCSLEPEENRGVVDAVLRGMRDFTLQQEQHHRAGLPADGAYQALLIRNSASYAAKV